MKKFFSLLLCALLIGGALPNAYAYNDGGNVNQKEVSGGSPSDPCRVYQLVRYGEVGVNMPSLSSGDVVSWDVISDDGVSVNKGGYLSTAFVSADAVAGVVVSLTIPTADSTGTASESIGKRNWGYIQTYGLNTDCQVSAAMNAGEGLIMSGSVPGFASPRGTVFNQKVFGFAYDTETGSNGGAEVFINNR